MWVEERMISTTSKRNDLAKYCTTDCFQENATLCVEEFQSATVWWGKSKMKPAPQPLYVIFSLGSQRNSWATINLSKTKQSSIVQLRMGSRPSGRDQALFADWKATQTLFREFPWRHTWTFWKRLLGGRTSNLEETTKLRDTLLGHKPKEKNTSSDQYWDESECCSDCIIAQYRMCILNEEGAESPSQRHTTKMSPQRIPMLGAVDQRMSTLLRLSRLP